MTARAQDDFYQSVNAEWLTNNPCPSDYSRWGTFEELAKINENQLREILEDKSDLASEWGCVQKLWSQGQDEAALNSLKFSDVLGAQLDAINHISSISGLVDLMLVFYRTGINVPVAFSPSPDLKNSDYMILEVDRHGLGLQDRDVYFDENMKDKREAYKEYLLTLTNHIKSEVTVDYLGDTDEVYKLEEILAESCMKKADRREPYNIYNPHKIDALQELCPNVNWNKVLADLGVNMSCEEYVCVNEVEFMKKLNTCLAEVSLNTWKHYLAVRLLSSTGKYLDDTTALIRFDFYGKIMSGQQEQKPRWKRVYYTINSLIGQIVGKRYVEKHFPGESKTQVLDMINRMLKVLEERIKNLPWMESETKEKALKKLGTFKVKIGYKWDDHSTLSLVADNYCNNIILCQDWHTTKEMAKCYKAVDKTEWHMTPQTVNAYYNPCQNEIVFPAGIIQPPMYDKDAAIAYNFGGIGAVICHEITHGFDDKGAKFDHVGNLENWWTDEDNKRFLECSDKLKVHFSDYTVHGMNVKGDLCLGENIADLGGLSISLEALSKMMDEQNRSEEEKREEMKKVFYAWAVIWRNNITEADAKRRIIMDPHSPGHLRVNGIVKNVSQFYDLFDVKSGDEMFLDDEKRSKIW